MASEILMAAVLLCAQPSASAVGDWTATLSVGGASLRLVLHLQTSVAGQLQGSLDSIDQGAKAIPASSVTVTGAHVVAIFSAIAARFEGDLDDGASTIVGRWSQGGSAPLTFVRRRAEASPAAAAAATPSDIDGDWRGMLIGQQGRLRVGLSIRNAPSGLVAEMTSVDQGGVVIPAATALRRGDALTLEFPGIGASFTGRVSGDASKIDGEWRQNGRMPLTLERGTWK